MVKDYTLRKEACVLIEADKLQRKGIASEQALELAHHSVNRTLWILRNKACMSRMQALEVLEDRQVQKRSKVKIMYFWKLGTYNEQLEYNEQVTDKIILSEVIKNYMLKSTTKKQSYLWIARQSRKVGLKPRELLELIDRLKYRQSCDTTVSNDSTITTYDIERNKKALEINLVEQLEQYLYKYKNKAIIVYGNSIMFTTLTYKALHSLIYTAYGRPNDTILLPLYQSYCDGDIHYKEDIVKDYINKVKKLNN